MRAHLLLAIGVLGSAGARAYAAGQPSPFEVKDGAALYGAACAACHGSDGKGAPRNRVGFETPLPDFTDCKFSTPEPDADWTAVVHQGGPARAFDRMMPAFGGALSDSAIERVLAYVRGFCQNASWPRGELNLPRALVTEKAFPENEAVLTTTIVGGGAGRIGTELLYERRFGARSQFEVAVPFEAQRADGGWHQGVGDIALAVKHALFHSLPLGTIVSVAAEAVLPTGKHSTGLGAGTGTFEPFVAVGQVLPRDGFLQFQAGVELPADPHRAEREAFWRGVFGRSILEGHFGRAWSPMMELVGAREIRGGEPTHWDVIPQLQVTLSRRQHIMLSGGVRLPLNERNGSRAQVMTYLLWDWFDGGFLDGWR